MEAEGEKVQEGIKKGENESQETREGIMRVHGVSLHDSKGAETCIDSYIHSNYKGVMGVNYRLIKHENNLWEVNGEIEVMKNIISTKRINFFSHVTEKGEILDLVVRN